MRKCYLFFRKRHQNRQRRATGLAQARAKVVVERGRSLRGAAALKPQWVRPESSIAGSEETRKAGVSVKEDGRLELGQSVHQRVSPLDTPDRARGRGEQLATEHLGRVDEAEKVREREKEADLVESGSTVLLQAATPSSSPLRECRAAC